MDAVEEATQNERPARDGRREVRIRGLPIHVWPQEEILAEMDRHICGSRCPQYISITCGELVYASARVSFLPDYIRGARFSVCDSFSLVLAAALQGDRVHRFTGPTLMERGCAYGTSRHWRHFFYGGPPGLGDLLGQRLSARFPGFITAGTLPSKFRELTPDEEEETMAAINGSKPDILWVGLGSVRQEAWITRYLPRLAVPWIIGVGAAFDYHAGTVPWAPKWIRAIGMEWLYRIRNEPWRFKRAMTCRQCA